MLILLQNEFWRKKKKVKIFLCAGGPIDKFDVMEFLFSYKEAAERLYSIGKTMDL